MTRANAPSVRAQREDRGFSVPGLFSLEQFVILIGGLLFSDAEPIDTITNFTGQFHERKSPIRRCCVLEDVSKHKMWIIMLARGSAGIEVTGHVTGRNGVTIPAI